MSRPQAKAQVVGAFGARGTGKTAWLTQQLQREKRLAIWDYKGDPKLRGWGTETRSLATFAKALTAPSFVLRYLPTRQGGALTVEDQFDRFCRACMLAGRLAMFVDELPAVTKANRAPPAWRECVNVGREYSREGETSILWLSIYATAQRPSECDKSFISNLDVLHTGRLSFANDAKVIAQSLGVSAQEVLQLPDLHWIEKRADKQQPQRGVLSFSGQKIKKNAAA